MDVNFSTIESVMENLAGKVKGRIELVYNHKEMYWVAELYDFRGDLIISTQIIVPFPGQPTGKVAGQIGMLEAVDELYERYEALVI